MAKVRRNKRADYWEVDYKDIFGKRKTKGGFKRKIDAEDFLLTITSDVKNGIQSQNQNMTFKEASDLFLELHVDVNCRFKTQYNYRIYLNRHILPCFGHIKIAEITPIMVKQFIGDKAKSGLAHSSINKFKKLMNCIFNMMVDDGIINRNPVARIKSLKETLTVEIDPLDPNEVQTLLNKTKVIFPDFYPLLFTAIYTGMRQGELLALTWDDINWQTGKIVVNKTYTQGRLGETKTGKIRKVDMSPQLMKMLKEWKLACPVSPYNLVFSNSNGQYIDANNMNKRRFKPSLLRAGLHLRRFHDLRHTYATLSLINNIPMKYVQHQLGHSSIKMTMDTYTHILPDVNEQCVAMLDNIMSIEEPKVQRFGT